MVHTLRLYTKGGEFMQNGYGEIVNWEQREQQDFKNREK